jgi:uncharacterized membrane protein HdeD (DUF308 family)
MRPEAEGGDKFVRMGAQRDHEDAGAGNLFRRAWWAVALRGVLAIIFGIMILTRPGTTLALLVATLGVYLFFDGLFTLVAAFRAAEHGRTWWPYLIEGLFSIAVGLLAFARPGSLLLFLVMLIAVRAIVVGAAEVGTGMSVRRTTGSSAWMLWLGGLASIVFGVLLIGNATFGLLALVWMAGIYTIVFGVLLDVEAFRLKDAGPRHLATRTT